MNRDLKPAPVGGRIQARLIMGEGEEWENDSMAGLPRKI
jgi:hypothetical protein